MKLLQVMIFYHRFWSIHQILLRSQYQVHLLTLRSQYLVHLDTEIQGSSDTVLQSTVVCFIFFSFKTATYKTKYSSKIKEKERENVQKESRKQNIQANRTKTVLFAITVMLNVKIGYSVIYALYGIRDSV